MDTASPEPKSAITIRRRSARTRASSSKPVKTSRTKPGHSLTINSSQTLRKCRLCASLGDSGVLVFSDEGKQMCLQTNIKKYLYITVSMEDTMSKLVCRSCCKVLEDFRDFANMAWKNEMKFIENKESKNIDNFLPKGLIHAYLTKELNRNDHNYVKILKKPTANSDDDGDDEDESKKSTKSISEFAEISKVTSNYYHCKDSDSNSHETLEVVVDPLQFLDDNSCCESDYHDSSSENNFRHHICVQNNNAFASEMFDDENVCPICGKSNFTSANLKIHLRIHRPKGKHECDTCKRIFKSPNSLLQHQQNHGRAQFTCENCARVYPTRSTLKAHLITHSDLRSHQCQLCEKSFKRNQDLKFHMNLHTGERPYKCLYCPKDFASSGNCYSHRKRMHPDEVERDRRFVSTILPTDVFDSREQETNFRT